MNNAVAQDSAMQKPLVFSGYAEGYYGYDFNKPANNDRPAFIYSHNRHNEFAVNLAFVKAAYASGRVRANVAMAAGTYMNANYAAEPGTFQNVLEANAGYKISRKKDLWFDIGIFPSHIGFEGAVSKDCWTLTRSMAAENSPYFESGGKVTYNTDNKKWLFSIMALNGWQRIRRVDGNSLMSFGTQVQYKPSGDLLFNYSSFIGTDKPDSNRLMRYFHNLYSTVNLSAKLDLTAGFDYGLEQASPKSKTMNSWYTPVVILRYKPTEQWAIAARGEYYDDEKGVIISAGAMPGFKASGISVNIDYLPEQNIALRLEAKTFKSKEAEFIKGQAFIERNTVVTFSAAVSF